MFVPLSTIPYRGPYRIALHSVLWLCYVMLFGFLWGSYESKYYDEFTIQLLLLPAKMLVVYTALYVLMPKFLVKKELLAFSFLLIAVMLSAGLLQRLIIYYLVYPYYRPQALQDGFWVLFKIIKYTVDISTLLFLASTVKILKLWYKDKQAAKSLEKEKLEAELNFLKAQIHPHFLFNILNNLYALTLKKSDAAPEVVLKLSELMNYMLYEAGADEVLLEKEINYIKNYLALEKLRYGDRVEVIFSPTGDLYQHKIAPMIMLPFVENCFKHGVSGETEDSWISIDLSVKNGLLTLKVENSKNPQKVAYSQKDYAGGIGLQNVKRRLELIYKDRYELKIFDEQDSYLIVLKLTLNDLNTTIGTKKAASVSSPYLTQLPVYDKAEVYHSR